MRDIYRVLSGAVGDETRLTQIANNLANVTTTGYKKDGAVFSDFLKEQMALNGEDQLSEKAKAIGAWPMVGSAYIDQTSGTLQATGRELDVAIDGDGFFQVKAPNETRPLYTRAGNFKLSAKGELLTADGKAVLSQSGVPITINPALGKIVVSSTGEIRTGTASAGQLGIVKFSNPEKLQKVGGGLMRAPEGVGSLPIDSTTIRQGMLEGSNVNAVDEMVRMIQTERSYNTAQKSIQTIDEATAKHIEAVSN